MTNVFRMGSIWDARGTMVLSSIAPSVAPGLCGSDSSGLEMRFLCSEDLLLRFMCSKSGTLLDEAMDYLALSALAGAGLAMLSYEP